MRTKFSIGVNMSLRAALDWMMGQESISVMSARQLAVLIIVAEEARPGGQTVRAMAEELRVAKPSITRAVDMLEVLDLVKRKDDPADRRSILVVPTRRGGIWVKNFKDLVAAAP
jgi:DNA-binding MarR family transcriptional regulator